LQALIPLFAYYAQFILKQLLNILKIPDVFTKDGLYKTMFISYTVIPVLNPLAAIFMIKSYRRSLIGILMRPLNGIYIEPIAESNNSAPSEASRPGTII
jgi:hypothetical protein